MRVPYHTRACLTLPGLRGSIGAHGARRRPRPAQPRRTDPPGRGEQSPQGVRRTVVPAAPDAWLTGLARWGTMSFADVVAPALECAERGFPISRFTAHQMAGQEATYRQWPTSAALFLRDGRPLRAGEI